MDLLNDLLLWLHISAVALGGAASFGIPVVGSRMKGASAEMRPVLFSISKQLSTLGRGAVVVLLVTGPLLVWLKFDGGAGFTAWFWIKMVLVVALIASLVFSGLLAKKAEGGDMAAAKRLPTISIVNISLFLAILASAVMTFS